MNRFFSIAVVALFVIGGCQSGVASPSIGAAPSAPTAQPTQTAPPAPTARPTQVAQPTQAAGPSILPAAGALEPGTYYHPEGVARFTFTLPEGWASTDGGSFVYRVSSPRPRDPYGVGEVLLTYWTVSHVYADACHHEATLVDAGTTTDELASLLVAQKGRVASAATNVTLGDSRPSGSS